MRVPTAKTSPRVLLDSFGDEMLAFLASWDGSPELGKAFQTQQELLRLKVEMESIAWQAVGAATIDLDEAEIFLAEVLRLLREEALSCGGDPDQPGCIAGLLPKSAGAIKKATPAKRLSLAEQAGKMFADETPPSVKAFEETLREACREAKEARSALDLARQNLDAAASATLAQAQEWLAAYRDVACLIEAGCCGSGH